MTTTQTPTEAQIQWAIKIQRQAATGTMVLNGKRITPADCRKAQRIMAEVQR